MKIDPERLRTLREQKGLSRLKLAERSGISERTIQRLENEPHRSQKSQGHTLNNLAKALGVKEKPGVLTGELPLPNSDKAPTGDNSDRVQMGAQVALKTRLAYDLIKRRYGVSATEIINMAPLFFVLLAEGSLARRRKKLKEIEDTYDRLYQIDVSWLSLPPFYDMDEHLCGGVAESEADSIDKADLFGIYLNNDFIGTPFDPSKENPFADYLLKMADDLAIPDVVDVARDGLSFGSPLKFPDYDVCRKERDRRDKIAKMCLKAGYARLSDIPEELMAEDAREERAKWIEDKLPDIYKERGEWNVFKEITATVPDDEIKKLLIEEEGDDQ